MLFGAHWVELRDNDVRKIFTSRFDEQVERYKALRRRVDEAELPSGWRVRVPALTAIDPAAASVVMTRAPGCTIQQAKDSGQSVPWFAIGEALGRLHRIPDGRGGGLYVHGDVSPNNVLFCADSQEVWLIDPAVTASDAPWQDVLCLQWYIYRYLWGLAAAVELFRGWHRTYGFAANHADMDRGWAENLRIHLDRQTSLLWLRRALRWGFRHLWIPLALRLAGRP
jgi:hypothetical protein